MSKKTKKPNKSTAWFKLMTSSMKGSRGYFIVGLIIAAVSVAVQFIMPMITAFVVDYVLADDRSTFSDFVVSLFEKIGDRQFFIDNLWVCALILLGVATCNGLFYFLRNYLLAKASEGTVRTLRNRLYTHIANLPYDYHKHTMTGDLIQRCTSDVETLRRFLGTQLLELVRCIGFVAVSLTLMFMLYPRLAYVSLIVPPILFVFSFFYFKKVLQQFKNSDEAEGAMSGMLNENVSGVRVVRAFGQQKREQIKFEAKNSEFRDITYKLNLLLGRYWGFSDFLGYLQIMLVLANAVLFAARGEISVGMVIIFLSYANYLTWPIRQLGRVLSDMGKAKVSLSRLVEITNAEEEKEVGKALTPKINGDIEFDHVCFGYDSDNEVLNGVTFNVKKGQTVAVLGSTGSGKSSLMHLLSRLYLCRGGEIRIDGVNINDIEMHHLRANIGTVMQEPFLYSRSIIENLRMANSDATDEEIYEATRSAAIHDTIMGFKEGYNTMVGEKGVTLSGGEKQRMSIARMLIQNAPIIIFDDSLSAVDTETDAVIRAALAKRRTSATTFIISHRITTLKESDFIVVLEDGKVSEIGTHEELCSKDGLYKRIADIQSFSDETEEII